MRKSCWVIPLLAASVSCRGAAAPLAGPTPAPTTTVSVPTSITVSTRCFGPFHPGDYVPLACVVEVVEGASPPSADLHAFADLRMFGGLAQSGIVECPACGGWIFDLDLHIPPDMSPGEKTFAVWATDAEGRRADTTATFQVTAR
jgi:hypothetical protein